MSVNLIYLFIPPSLHPSLHTSTYLPTRMTCHLRLSSKHASPALEAQCPNPQPEMVVASVSGRWVRTEPERGASGAHGTSSRVARQLPLGTRVSFVSGIVRRVHPTHLHTYEYTYTYAHE